MPTSSSLVFTLHAVGGEQVLLCKVSYEPGKEVRRHSHEHTEQVMYILEGEVTMTIEGETDAPGRGHRRRQSRSRARAPL